MGSLAKDGINAEDGTGILLNSLNAKEEEEEEEEEEEAESLS